MFNFSFSLPWNNRPVSNMSATAAIPRPSTSGVGERVLSSPSMREAVGQTAGRILLGSCKMLAAGGAVLLTGVAAHAAYNEISRHIRAYFDARNINRHIVSYLKISYSRIEKMINSASIPETDRGPLRAEFEEIKRQVSGIADLWDPTKGLERWREAEGKLKEFSEKLTRYELNTPNRSS